MPGTPAARFQSQPRWPVLKAFSGANVLFEVFTRSSETIVAPAFRKQSNFREQADWTENPAVGSSAPQRIFVLRVHLFCRDVN